MNDINPAHLNIYRQLILGTHLYFTNWIINIWGFQLKTFLFLTQINFFTNLFYFFYSGIYLVYFSKKSESKEKFVNSIFKFSFCLSVAVIILYWSLALLAPGMLGDTPTPPALDLFLHGGNLLVLLIDCLLNSKACFRDTYISRHFLVKFTIAYFMTQYLVYYTMDIEIYPMISKLSVPMYSLVGAAGNGLFLIGEFFFSKILLPKVKVENTIIS